MFLLTNSMYSNVLGRKETNLHIIFYLSMEILIGRLVFLLWGAGISKVIRLYLWALELHILVNIHFPFCHRLEGIYVY